MSTFRQRLEIERDTLHNSQLSFRFLSTYPTSIGTKIKTYFQSRTRLALYQLIHAQLDHIRGIVRRMWSGQEIVVFNDCRGGDGYIIVVTPTHQQQGSRMTKRQSGSTQGEGGGKWIVTP